VVSITGSGNYERVAQALATKVFKAPFASLDRATCATDKVARIAKVTVCAATAVRFVASCATEYVLSLAASAADRPVACLTSIELDAVGTVRRVACIASVDGCTIVAIELFAAIAKSNFRATVAGWFTTSVAPLESDILLLAAGVADTFVAINAQLHEIKGTRIITIQWPFAEIARN
jgi:hypothetical protein